MKMFRISNVSVQLTPSEASVVAWALDPMRDFWCTEDGAYSRGGLQYEESHLPNLIGNSLVLSDVPEINEDLEYRITTQLYEMSLEGGDAVEVANMTGVRTIRVIRSLSRKLGWDS